MKGINNLNELVKINTLEHHPFFSTNADQYLKWTPMAAVMIMDAIGIKTSHNWKNHLAIIGTSICLLNGIVQPLKKYTKEIRPNWSAKEDSFPSSHTATCFLGAEIVHQELRSNYPLISYSSYALASVTGIIRILKNKHWVTDVAVGATLGIAVGKFTYLLVKKLQKKEVDYRVS
ncbi:MAG TPA: phosphatase PAP2 family protein [Flavisolibacter sp.]|nr:phosphatase PAP2 family protein [Flavisolibacter sp.]